MVEVGEESGDEDGGGMISSTLRGIFRKKCVFLFPLLVYLCIPLGLLCVCVSASARPLTPACGYLSAIHCAWGWLVCVAREKAEEEVIKFSDMMHGPKAYYFRPPPHAEHGTDEGWTLVRLRLRLQQLNWQ